MKRAMSLMEYIVQEAILIDFGEDYELGSDQAYVSYPCRFATVRFKLIDTSILCLIADRIREEAGFKPLYEGANEMSNPEGWYEFLLGINDYTESKLDSCITFELVNSPSPDAERTYVIDLSLEEQKLIYEQLNAECKEHIGKSCEELLSEARDEMVRGEGN